MLAKFYMRHGNSIRRGTHADVIPNAAATERKVRDAPPPGVAARDAATSAGGDAGGPVEC